MGKTDLVSVKALQLAVSNGQESSHNSWDGSYFVTTRKAAERAYQEAGITKPRDEISMFECHDCFSVTELVTMEDLYISEEGEAWQDVLDGLKLQPCQPTMVDARDAIILADEQNYGGRHTCVLWCGFARRGFGVSAHSSSFTNRDVEEAFDYPQSCSCDELYSKANARMASA